MDLTVGSCAGAAHSLDELGAPVTLTPPVSSVIGSSNPVVAAVAAVVILGQPLTVVQVVCGLAGIAGNRDRRRTATANRWSRRWSENVARPAGY